MAVPGVHGAAPRPLTNGLHDATAARPTNHRGRARWGAHPAAATLFWRLKHGRTVQGILNRMRCWQCIPPMINARPAPAK